MCGHLTIFSGSAPVAEKALWKGIRALAHRGPDAVDIWNSPSRRVGLAHSRLSIIDLTSGDQPLHTADGTLHAVVNGEFYGYEAIRKSLVAEGHRFATKSDSEILLHLYRRHGFACLSRLRGEFAFSLWDEEQQVLFAARDRFGIKPLFYSQVGDTLYLASEAKALFAAGVPARWDEESIAHVHQSMVLLPGRSLFENVHQLLPGHFLVASEGQRQVRAYWDLSYPTAHELGEAASSQEECVEEVRARLHDAIRVRLRADVPVGCYLSGGLDSCAILGIASLYSSAPVETFTVAFTEEGFDAFNEATQAEEMARHAGAIFTPVPISSDDLATHLPEALWHAEAPMSNMHGVAKFILSAAARRAGCKVVLTGEGADEVFAGYATFRRDRSPGSPEGRIDAMEQALGFTPAFLKPSGRQAATAATLLRPEWRDTIMRQDYCRLLLEQFDLPGKFMGRHPVNQSSYLRFKTWLPGYLLSVLGDRMEMSHSVEGRLPMLDHLLVEAVASVPVHFKINDAIEKHVLREAARPVLTGAAYRREKHPFMAPPVLGSEGGFMYELVNDTLRGRQLDAVPFYDRRRVATFLDKVAALDERQRAGLDAVVMLVLSLTILQSRFSL